MMLDRPLVQIPMIVDPDVARALGTALDITCSLLHHKPTSVSVRETIIRNILEAVKQGERDPLRLRDAGLAALADHDIVATGPIGTARKDLNPKKAL